MSLRLRDLHPVPAETRRAVFRALRRGVKPLKAEPRPTLSEWAAQHFEMDEESSHKRGLWEPWAFQVGWMDAFSNPDIEEVDVKKAKRVGYTKTLVASAAYDAVFGIKQAIWQPTDDDRDSFEKSEIAPAFDLCKPLRAVRRAGKDQDTIKFKRFRGSVMHLLGAKAARSFRRITVSSAKLDEVDAMDSVVEKTIDPISGAWGRTEGAAFRKLIIGSTPRIKGISLLEGRVAAADARMLFHIPCPRCGVETPLLWGGKDVAHGFKWEGRDPKTAPATVRHVCPHCRDAFSQSEYLAVYAQGAWVDVRRHAYRYGPDRVWRDAEGNPCRPPRHVAFDMVWTAYSPQRTWADIVREFLECRIELKKGNKGPMMGFVNETLADLWEEEFEQTDADKLLARAAAEPKIPLRVVPAGACKVLMTIDTQGNRWEAMAWAIGRDEEIWPIDYQVIYGNLADPSEWAAKLDPLIATTYRHQHGQQLPVEAVALDTGGNYTQLAYAFCRARTHRKVYAIKGDKVLNKPIVLPPTRVDVSYRGKVMKKGLKLWLVCVDSAKDLLHERLEQIARPGPYCIHLHPELPPEWYAQLTAEKRIPVRTDRGVEYRWTCPPGQRNEAWDLAVYLFWLVRMEKLDAKPASTWDDWERALLPDLFAPPPEFPDLATAPAVPADAPATGAPAAPAPALPTPPAPKKPPQRPAPPPQRSAFGSSDWSSRL